MKNSSTLASDKKNDMNDKTYGLDIHGITEISKTNWDLSPNELLEIAVSRKEGILTNTNAFACTTGEFTGRSPKDRFIVKDSKTLETVDWGTVNQAMSTEHFEALRKDQLEYLKGKEVFARETCAGADKTHQIKVRVINESAWANLFCHHMLIRPEKNTLKDFKPDFTIIHTPGFNADPGKHGTKSKTFIVINLTEKLVIIGGTYYAGEMKKSVFAIMNYLYPLQGILSMHCSANLGKNNDTALFFGLSGTGKTTLSADPERSLIGDDEHGWSDRGVFNFEGGCYAKCIRLSREKEPQIWDAIRDTAILENVVVDKDTGIPDYDDGSLAENSRVAYPIEYIEGALPGVMASHPKNIIFLTCDAFGVMPPISKLTKEQAMYHFLSGYTAKVAGTERGGDNTPKAVFSACFGAPFFPLKPTLYAKLLGEKMDAHSANCWLINTGWVGGGYGVGERMKLSYTRQLINSALAGELDKCEYNSTPFFGLAIPKSVTGVPTELLTPKNSWKDKEAFDVAAENLAQRFRENFKRFESFAPELVAAGPKI